MFDWREWCDRSSTVREVLVEAGHGKEGGVGAVLLEGVRERRKNAFVYFP